MKVILTSEVSNLGKIGDVVSVRDGYAKNFLVPKNKAIYFTANNKKVFEQKKEQFEKENSENLSAAESIRNEILGKDIIIIEHASDDGRLYGSVSIAVIADNINKILKDKSVERADIFLAKPIKDIGVYNIAIAPHSDVKFNIRLIVSRSEDEVKALLKDHDKSQKEYAKKEPASEKKNKKEKTVEKEEKTSEEEENSKTAAE